MADETKENLQAAMRRYGKAWFEGDGETLKALLSETYTHNDSNGGRSDREGFLRIVENLQGRLAGLAFRDVQTRLIDRVGIITGLSFMRMNVDAPHKQEVARLTFTQVWRQRGDNWQIEAFQATLAPVSGAQQLEISEVGT
jgi:hypothetical protein